MFLFTLLFSGGMPCLLRPPRQKKTDKISHFQGMLKIHVQTIPDMDKPFSVGAAFLCPNFEMAGMCVRQLTYAFYTRID